jgi:putative ABC transport system permease protein
MLLRDFRAGELRLLLLAMVLAVASLTSVSFFTDRLGRALDREAHQLLGGDLLLIADHPWDPSFADEARRRGLQVAHSLSFPSMVSGHDQAQLADIKGVEPGYPLRGALRVAPGINQPDRETRQTPARGSAWPDQRLVSALGLKVGDQVTVGESRLTVAAVLTLEPDRGINLFNIAPRLLVHGDDLPATRLIQVGSRVAYRLHVAGEEAVVAAYRKWVQQRLGRGQRLESIDNARPEVRSALDRAQKFLRLAALLAVVLAAVAVGLGARRFMQRHLDGCAVMRVLGARQNQVLAIYQGEFLLLGLIASVTGCAVGFGAQRVLEYLLADLLATALPAPSWLPFAYGLAVGVTLLVGFATPQLLRLRNVPTVRVLRREWAGSEPVAARSYVFGAAALALLILAMAGELKLGLWVLGGFAAAVLVYAVAARLALGLARRVRGMGGAGWRYGIASLARRLGSSVVQAVALGLGMTALLLLTQTHDDLVQTWRHSVPRDAPNRFIINIQPEQREPLRQFFAARALPVPELLPMVRGRLVAVNDRPVTPADYENERAQRLVEREFNLSWMDQVPEGNRISAGRWFAPGETGRPQFSVEQGLAETLGLAVGDTLTYEIAGQRLAAPVTSLRQLDWDSMRVNFFVIAPPGVLDDYPTNFITAFHLPDDRAGFINELIAAFPNLTVIDAAALIRQFQSVMGQLTRAVQFVFVFALLAGLVVLYAAIEATHDERQFELAVMRTLGARNGQLRAALAAEFCALGAIAGLLAGVGASAIGYVIGRFVFQLPYAPSVTAVAAGLIAGVVGVTLAGLAGTVRTLRLPALQSLRAL